MKDQYITRMRQQKDGDSIFALYLTMLTESIDHDGELRSADGVPFTTDTLVLLAFRDCLISAATAAKDIKRYTEIVERGLEFFKQYQLITIDGAGTIRMEKLEDKIGTTSTERSRACRERQKVQQPATLQPVASNAEPQHESNEKRSGIKNLELDVKNTDKRERAKAGSNPATRAAIPTLEAVKQYCQEKKYTMDPDRFFAHYGAREWILTGGQPVRNWMSLADAWETGEKKYAASGKRNDKPEAKIEWLDEYMKNIK